MCPCCQKPPSSALCSVGTKDYPCQGPAQEQRQVGHVQAVPGVCCVMPVLATAHYYSRYEFEVSQRVPKVIMGRHQRRSSWLQTCPAGTRMMRERTDTSQTAPATARPCHPHRWICAQGKLFGWEKHSWLSGNKAEVLWLLSPLPSAMLSVPSALTAGPQQLGLTVGTGYLLGWRCLSRGLAPGAGSPWHRQPG